MGPDAYPDAVAHLHDEFQLLDARLQRRLVSGDWDTTAVTDSPTTTEVDAPTDASDDTNTATDTDRRGRINRRVAATETTDVVLPLIDLAARFDLGRTERNALVAAVASVVDPDYGSLFGYLQDDGHQRQPTVGLLVNLLAETARERFAVRNLFAQDAPLRATRLIRLTGEATTPRVARVVVVDDRLADFLLGTDSLPVSLADCCSVTTPTGRLADLPLESATIDHIRTITERMLDGGGDATERPVYAHLHGPTGVGTEATVAAGCAEAGVERLLDCDAAGLVPDDTVGCDRQRVVGERLQLLVREARLRDCPLHLRNLDKLRESVTAGRSSDSESGNEVTKPDITLLGRAVKVLDRATSPVFTTGSANLSPTDRIRPSRHEVVSVEIAAPSYERRRSLWAAVDDLPAAVSPATLAATFQLTSGGIEEVVAIARADTAAETGVANDGTLTREAIYAGCRAVTGAALGRHARKVEPSFGWDDIVLPAEPARRLRELAGRIASEGRVYDDWGFGARYARGGGIAALFTGPSGTGKTMAAEVLAHESGCDLYKIDLASVVSKYVGETETRLGEIFDGSAGSNAILLFDEADALFGKRSQVSDAHDRYANVETNYLLQRIEEHDGTVLLTSNFPENIDNAFRRRLHLTISFPRPNADARETIWRGVFPAETPVGDLDYAFLASFELTGGDVKNAALTAAFLAVSEQRRERVAAARNSETVDGDAARVEMRHVVPAVRDEVEKTGSLIDPAAFGDYWEVING